jgi:hypothetical protein
MRHVGKEHPARSSRDAARAALPPSDNEVGETRNDQTKDDEGDLCLDNDLGAEWTGNIDCNDGSKNQEQGETEIVDTMVSPRSKRRYI